MLRYARDNALVLTPELIRQIAWLDAALKLNNISPISALTSVLVGEMSAKTVALGYVAGKSSAVTPVAPDEGVQQPLPAGTPIPTPLSTEEVVLRVHSDLSLLIALTTALSLQSSEPAPGRIRIFGGMPRLVKTAIVIAVISAFAFVISAVKVNKIGAEKKVEEAKKLALEAVPPKSPASTPPATLSGAATTPKTTASDSLGMISGEKK